MRWLAGARGLAVAGILAPAIFTGAWITAGLVQHDYDVAREDISGLAARTAEHAWLMVAGLVVSGFLTAAFAVGLHGAVDRGRGSKLGPALIGLAGLGLIGLGVLRNDCSSLTAVCKARVEAGDVSWQHTAHDVLSAPVFAAAILAPLVLAPRFRADPRWSRLAPLSLGAGPILAVLFALGAIEPFPSFNGAIQRAAATAAFAYSEVVAVYAFRLRKS